MKLYLDTSTPTVILRLDQDEFQWQANREMAKGILQFISSKLQEKNLEWQDIEDITFYMSGTATMDVAKYRIKEK